MVNSKYIILLWILIKTSFLCIDKVNCNNIYKLLRYCTEARKKKLVTFNNCRYDFKRSLLLHIPFNRISPARILFVIGS